MLAYLGDCILKFKMYLSFTYQQIQFKSVHMMQASWEKRCITCIQALFQFPKSVWGNMSAPEDDWLGASWCPDVLPPPIHGQTVLVASFLPLFLASQS